MNGSLQLSEYPGDMVRLSCEKCGRSGQYRKQKLIERYGALSKEVAAMVKTATPRYGRQHWGALKAVS